MKRYTFIQKSRFLSLPLLASLALVTACSGAPPAADSSSSTAAAVSGSPAGIPMFEHAASSATTQATGVVRWTTERLGGTFVTRGVRADGSSALEVESMIERGSDGSPRSSVMWLVAPVQGQLRVDLQGNVLDNTLPSSDESAQLLAALASDTQGPGLTPQGIVPMTRPTCGYGIVGMVGACLLGGLGMATVFGAIAGAGLCGEGVGLAAGACL
jgi:hypothetical protein